MTTDTPTPSPIDLKTLKYKNNFLEQVVFRIDFDEILKISEKPILFQEKVRGDFPHFEQRAINNFHTVIEGDNARVEKQEQVIWDFLNKEKSFKVSFSTSFFVVEISKYSNYNDFKSQLERLYRDFASIYNPISSRRVGLRFINKIHFPTGNPLDWNGYIANELFTAVSSWDNGRKTDVRRSLGQMIFKSDDEVLTFTYGLFNSEYPSKISRKEFILDYDCYTEEVRDGDVVSNYLDPFHLKILELFEKSIGDDLRANLERIS